MKVKSNQIPQAEFKRLVQLVNDGHNIGMELQELTGYESGVRFQSEMNRIYAASDFKD